MRTGKNLISQDCQVESPISNKLKLILFRRILLYSSFTPFLVVFTHSIASHSNEDLELLTQVLHTLEAPRGHSEAVNRLYQVCRVFLEFAKAFVPLQQPSFGIYNQEEDSFTFPPNLSDGSTQIDNLTSYDPLIDGGEMKYDDLESMSAYLGSCLGENTAMSGLWNMDFSNSQFM